MDKRFELTVLMDFYAPLLTEHRRQILSLRLEEDLTFQEIADQLGISRQGVHDALVRTEAALRTTEQRLGCVSRARTLQRAYTDLAALAEDLRTAGRDDFAVRILAAADLIKE